METGGHNVSHSGGGEIRIFLDDGREPLATYRPPAVFHLDTTSMVDGEHVLSLEATDALGRVGIRRIPFTVANGPGITVAGLRPGARIRGAIDININAFGSDEPFDPVRAESMDPIPVWTWVMIILICAWAGWYGLEYFATPPAFAVTPTYAANPALAGTQPVATTEPAAPQAAAGKSVAGFDYSKLGPQVYTQNCSACHGAGGAGVPGAFPALAGDPVVNGAADAQIKIVLHGLSGKTIGGVKYASMMPAFAAQLSDAEIAAVIDHERTSWGNHGALVTPGQIRRGR
jgi:mono/diheme cytochrome c family protein